jgi:hypothetical protein
MYIFVCISQGNLLLPSSWGTSLYVGDFNQLCWGHWNKQISSLVSRAVKISRCEWQLKHLEGYLFSCPRLNLIKIGLRVLQSFCAYRHMDSAIPPFEDQREVKHPYVKLVPGTRTSSTEWSSHFMFKGPSRKVPTTPVIFNETWILPTDCRKILRYQISWKSIQRERSCSMRMDRHMMKLIFTFYNFVNVPETVHSITDLLL